MEEGSRLIRILAIAGTILGVLLIVGIGIFLLSTTNPSLPGKTTIRWVVDPNPIRKEQIKLFERKHPNIHVINDPGAEAQRLLTQLAGDVPPGVMALYDPQTIRLFAKNGVLLDLGPYVKRYGLPVDRLYPGLKPYYEYQGKVVGVPENCGPYVLFYNRKLFRQAGIPYPKPDWTWDQCLEVAKKLTLYKSVNGRQVPVRKGLYVGTTDWFFFIWMYNGRLFSPDGKTCVINSEAARKGIRFWADLRLKYHVTPTTSEAQSMAPTGAWGSDALLFRENRVAMNLSGRWLAIQYREQKDLDWDVVSAPHGPNRVTLLASKIYAIPQTCKHKHEALIFLKHLLSMDNQLLVANYGDGMPTLQDPAIIKAFSYNPEFPNERNNRLHVDEMKYARVQEFSPYINALDAGAIMGVEFDKMWLKRQTPDEACDEIARQINAVIRRNLANPNFLD